MHHEPARRGNAEVIVVNGDDDEDIELPAVVHYEDNYGDYEADVPASQPTYERQSHDDLVDGELPVIKSGEVFYEGEDPYVVQGGRTTQVEEPHHGDDFGDHAHVEEPYHGDDFGDHAYVPDQEP